MILVPMILPIWRRRFAAEIWAMPEEGPQNDARLWWRGINHNRKGGAFEIEQPKVGPKGESRPWGRSRKTADRQLRRRSGLGEPANQPSGSERVKGHRG